MERIKVFVKKNESLRPDEIDRKFQVLQKEMLDEVKGLLFANYKGADSSTSKECPRMSRLTAENKLLLGQLKDTGKELLLKSEQLQEKNSQVEKLQKELKRLELEQTVSKIQENIEKDQNQELVARLEDQVFSLSQKLNLIKDAVNS
ncbi:hypothetical protein HWI79_2342 [Cryptosporidium felis]|nr:hypothetical protein HWI79_2342 [Cryptosporidium felis]